MKKDLNKEEEKLRAALKGKNPFNIPSGYFEELPEKIIDQINGLPDFDKTSVVNPFAVPEGYFENLSSTLAGKIVTQKSKLESWLSGLQRPRIAIPIAFATMIMLAGLYFYKQRCIITPPTQEFSADDLRNSSYIQSIDEDLFVDVLSGQKDVNKDESLEQYLIDNNIELSQIENKL